MALGADSRRCFTIDFFQRAVDTFVRAQSSAISRINNLESQIASYRSHIGSLKRELHNACYRQSENPADTQVIPRESHVSVFILNLESVRFRNSHVVLFFGLGDWVLSIEPSPGACNSVVWIGSIKNKTLF